ncbi:hypothetical protein HMPREF1207_05487 [Paenibacillus sp. HGH0039]|nr:hypothetical protein HMPREF1207_05487 [Paenibacillus sp. HGH0039]
MNVFVTGATGWIGSATVDELLKAGHKVVGLVRSDVSAASLEAKGAKVLRGDLDDLDSLRRGAAEAEAVVHLANKHDFANPAESDRAERAAVETLAEALVGTNRPFMVATGMSGLFQGRPVLETDPSPDVSPDSHRGGAENLALDYVGRGVRTIIIRFAPTVHGAGDWGFVNFLVSAARKHGVSGTSMTAPTHGPRCTVRMPPSSSGLESRRRRPDHACMRSQRKPSPPGRSPKPSDAPSISR